jgi:hypothetical protein
MHETRVWINTLFQELRMKSTIKLFLPFLGLVIVTASLQISSKPGNLYRPVKAGVLDGTYLKEVSGMVRSLYRNDVYWVVNDSGGEAALYAIDGQGQMITGAAHPHTFRGDYAGSNHEPSREFRLSGSSNIDWESMTSDGRYLYIADTGNNLNYRRNLGIYRLLEKNPEETDTPLVIDFLPIAYPEQTAYPGLGPRHFDSEALFAADGSLYLITKHRNRTGSLMERGANLYRLDTGYTDRVNALTLVESSDRLKAVTGAELSPDGQKLAVISYEAIWLFDRPSTGDQWLSAPSRRILLDTQFAGQVETVEWQDNSALLITNESRDLFLVPLADFARLAGSEGEGI